MATTTSHRVTPEQVFDIGPTYTDCCGADVLRLPDGDNVCFTWANVTCMTRLTREQPRPPCPRCGGEMFLIDDGDLCNRDRWLLGHDCAPCPGLPPVS